MTLPSKIVAVVSSRTAGPLVPIPTSCGCGGSVSSVFSFWFFLLFGSVGFFFFSFVVVTMDFVAWRRVESQPRASSTAVGEIIDQGGPTTVVEHTPQAVSYSTVDSMAPRSVCSVGYPYFNNESYCTTSRRTFSDKARFYQW